MCFMNALGMRHDVTAPFSTSPPPLRQHDIAATFVPHPGMQHEVNGLSPILLRIAMGYGV